MAEKGKGRVVGGVGEVSEVVGEELAAISEEAEIDQKLREWAARENPENLTIRTYIYKFDGVGETKMLCDRVDDEIPDPHSVGLQFGAGRYMLVVSIPDGAAQKKRVRGLRFRLHPRYDDLRKANGANVAGPPAVVPVVSSGDNGLRGALDLVRGVVETLAPILAAQKAAVVPDFGKLLEGQYDLMRGIMAKSLADSQSLIQEVQKARLESEVSDDQDFLDRLGPLVEKFLPALLGGGPGARATAAAVRAIPQVQRVIANNSELRRIVAWLDKTKGREATDQILAALKVRRPRAPRNDAEGSVGSGEVVRGAVGGSGG